MLRSFVEASVNPRMDLLKKLDAARACRRFGKEGALAAEKYEAEVEKAIRLSFGVRRVRRAA